MTLLAEFAADTACRLGEGPIWDVRQQRLLWVDILASEIHWFDPGEGINGHVALPEPISALAPRRDGGFVAATRAGVAFLDVGFQTLEHAVTIEDSPATRLNEGKCDASGRFWVGSMAFDTANQGAAALYCVEPDLSVRRVLEGVTVSNGLDWTADNGTMYYIDSLGYSLDRFNFDAAAGTIGSRAQVAVIPQGDGLPDGLCIDEEGCLWVAVAYAGEVRRYSSAGEQLESVRVPTSVVTSCCFGGTKLTDLYITTAAEYVPAERKALEPHAGALFRCRVPTAGRAPNVFQG